MHARLQGWGESTVPPTTVMGWMGMAMAADSMPGLATDAQMQRLAELIGASQGREFLELMRAHHVGGVSMADAAAEKAQVADVAALASRLSAVQSYEIALFDQLLSDTYADA